MQKFLNLIWKFCEIYSLTNLIKVPTCFKNPLNPNSIDVVLSNRAGSFQNSAIIETGLSDRHKMTTTVLNSFFQKQSPITIRYRDYRNFEIDIFRRELLKALNCHNKRGMTYDIFEGIFVRLHSSHAPLKEMYVRANGASFMNKTLSKAFMTRSRLRNKFLNNPSLENESNYKKYRNHCTSLVRKKHRHFLATLTLTLSRITRNKAAIIIKGKKDLKNHNRTF